MPLPPLLLATNRALNKLGGLTRAELLGLAQVHVQVPWIEEAFVYAQPRDITVLGRFNLEGPSAFLVDGKRPPWPAVLLRIRRRPRTAGQSDRAAIVAVYVDENGQWEANAREADKVPWAQYVGDRHGAPSVLNGDRPGDAPDPPPVLTD